MFVGSNNWSISVVEIREYITWPDRFLIQFM